MSGKNKHTKKDRQAFHDYLSDKMSGEERNAFERELEKDPFAAEAMEGLSSLSEDEIDRTFAIWRPGCMPVPEAVTAGSCFIASRQQWQRWSWLPRSTLLSAGRSGNMKQDRIARIEKTENVQEKENTDSGLPAAAGQKQEKDVLREPDEKSSPGQDESPVRTPSPRAETESVNPPQKEKARANATPAVSEPDRQDEAAASPFTSDDQNQETRQAAGPAPAPETSITQATGKKTAPPIRRSAAMKAKAGITGTVRSADDSSPIPGAIIRLKDSKTGTVTDSEGHFELNVPEDSSVTLVADFIGMKSASVNARGWSECRH